MTSKTETTRTNKTQMVKEVLAQHPEATPKEIVEEMKTSSGIDIKPNEVSAIKSKLSGGKSKKIDEAQAYKYANGLGEWLAGEMKIKDTAMVSEIIKRVGKTIARCGDAEGVILRMGKKVEVNWDE